MTFRDLDRPHMVYQGALPRHLTQRADEPTDQAPEADDGDAGVTVPAVALVAVALVIGVALGAGVTAVLLSKPHPAAAHAVAVAAPSAPRLSTVRTEPTPPPTVEAPLAEATAAIAPTLAAAKAPAAMPKARGT